MSLCNDPVKASEAPPKPIALGDIFDSPLSKTDFWTDFGLISTGSASRILPAGVIVLEAREEAAHTALIDLLKTMGVPSHAALWSGDLRQAFYRLADQALLPALESVIPDGVTLICQGEAIEPVEGLRPSAFSARSVNDLSELTAANIAQVGSRRVDPERTSNPLLPFSVRGQSEKFRRLATEASPLLGEVCLKGQVTIWYAGPGTGKTLLALSLIIDAVRDGRIAAGNIYYINADDNASGFAAKLQLLDDIGAHTLSPGIKGFRNHEFTSLLYKMAEDDEAKGVLIVVDTIKKFASLMEKRESSAIANAFRQVAMKGGTILGLAHTTKNANADGSARYAGTTDLVDDADAVYTITTLSASNEDKERVIEFRQLKARGDCAESAAYAFAAEKGVAYEEMLASVRPIDTTTLDEFKRVEVERSDADIIEAIATCIRENVNTKMMLAKAVAARLNISGRQATRVIERYTGDDPVQHRWRFRRGDRSALLFELLPEAAPAT